jgi:hypothetical protein
MEVNSFRLANREVHRDQYTTAMNIVDGAVGTPEYEGLPGSIYLLRIY